MELPETARRVLRDVYPTLELSRLRFHLGIPHLVRIAGLQGIALPGRVWPRRVRIYIDPAWWDPGSDAGLGLLIHECFHALQLQESGPGLGLLRPFVILYLACASGNRFRYAGHPLEDDAYRIAADEAVASSNLRFWRRLAESTPGWRSLLRSHLPSPLQRLLLSLLVPWVALWLLLWTAIVALLALLKGLLEGVGAVLVGALRIGTDRPPAI